MSSTTDYRDYWVNPRLKIATLWTSMLFVFVCVDLFGMYRSDVRADIEAGKIAAFTIGQGYLLGVMVYVAVPSLMLFLSLVLPVKITRMANVVLAALYAVTIVGSAVGEWNYFIFGSVIETALLAAIGFYAWTWPKTAEAFATSGGEQSRDTKRSELSVESPEEVATTRG